VADLTAMRAEFRRAGAGDGVSGRVCRSAWDGVPRADGVFELMP